MIDWPTLPNRSSKTHHERKAERMSNKERDLFEEWYCQDAGMQGISMNEGIAHLREGNRYGEARVSLNGKWEGWQAKAARNEFQPKCPVKWIYEYPGDVFVVFDPTTDGACIAGAARTLEEAQEILSRVGEEPKNPHLIEYEAAHRVAFQAAAAFRPDYFNGSGFRAHNWVVEAIRSAHMDGERYAQGLPPIDRSTGEFRTRTAEEKFGAPPQST